jgi:multidrug efflux pump subunit AcrA (membrane-fusion protein)
MIKATQAKIDEAQSTVHALGINPAEAKAQADLLVQLNKQLQGLKSLKETLRSTRVPAPVGTPGNSRGYLTYPPAILPPQ